MRKPVGKAERQAVEALHTAAGDLLAADDVAKAYFARIKLAGAIEGLMVLSAQAKARVEAKR